MSMYQKIELILKDEHKNSGVKKIEDFSHAKASSNAIITMEEFFQSCKHYPIVFSKNEKEGWFALALLGLKNSNIFVDEEGAWREECYIPAYIRRYPFIFVQNNQELLLGFDAQHKVDKEEADSRYFFDENGEKTEFVDNVLKFMNQVQISSQQTKEFIETLAEMDLLEESTINGTNKEGQEIALNGFWVLNEEKLNKTTQKNRTLLCKKNYMQAITAHLISLSNISNLNK